MVGENCILISVVLNMGIYDRLVVKNPKLAAYEKYMLDNRVENLGVPTRYNQFLNGYDYTHPAWFVFCHEDFEMKQDLEFLNKLPHEALYGPIGTRIEGKKVVLIGRIHHSDKDGSCCEEVGRRVSGLQEVLTFDCQCVIVHSDLVARHHLRFDENLPYDLYVEDFCIAAAERYGIPSMVVQMDCHHHSHGKLQLRFLEGMIYMMRKWEEASKRYASTMGLFAIGTHEFQKLSFESRPFWSKVKRIFKKICCPH